MLAQDDGGVFVLTRQPLKSVFRIPAWDAAPAMFTPDSQFIVYLIGGFGESPRIEKWNIGSQTRSEVHEIHVGKGCLNPSLSPDGRNLVCVIDASSDEDFRLDLVLYDTASGSEVWRSKNWWNPGPMFGYWETVSLLRGGEKQFGTWLPIHFSPDGRYLLASGLNKHVCFELATHSVVALPQGVSKLIGQTNSTFLSNDRFIGLKDDSGKARVVKFSSGEVVADDVMIGSATPSAVAKGDYVLLRPLKKEPVGLMDLSRKQIIVAGKMSAMDVWGNSCIGEQADGSIENFDLATNKTVEKVRLPEAPIGKLTAGGVSSDLAWLAMSQRTRGAVWNLKTGQQLYRVPGFSGAYFDSGTALYTDFYKLPDSERMIGEMSLPKPHYEPKQTLDEKLRVTQNGKYLLEYIPAHANSWDGNVTIEVHDVRDNKLLWSKHFAQGQPDGWITSESHLLVLYWPAGSKAIKSLVKEDPEAAAKLKPFHDKQGIVFVQVLNLETGKVQSTAVLDTGKNSFSAKSVSVSGSRMILSDDQNRVSVYSFDGKRLASFPGRQFDVSTDLLLVNEESQSEKLALYDLAKLERITEYVFESPVIVKEFSSDGKRLLVVTADQAVYFIDPAASASPAKLTSKQEAPAISHP